VDDKAQRPNRILDLSAYGIGRSERRRRGNAACYDGRPTDAINYLARSTRQYARLSVYR